MAGRTGKHFAAKAMVEDFDNNGVFVSGEYKLLPPPPSARLTGKAHARERSGISSNKTPLHRSPASRNIFRAKESPK